MPVPARPVAPCLRHGSVPAAASPRRPAVRLASNGDRCRAYWAVARLQAAEVLLPGAIVCCLVVPSILAELSEERRIDRAEDEPAGVLGEIHHEVLAVRVRIGPVEHPAPLLAARVVEVA